MEVIFQLTDDLRCKAQVVTTSQTDQRLAAHFRNRIPQAILERLLSSGEFDSSWLPNANVAQLRTSRSVSPDSFASASTTFGVSCGINP